MTETPHTTTLGNLTFTAPASLGSPTGTLPAIQQKPAEPKADEPEYEHGFPPGTPVAQMTAEQRAAYDTHVKTRNAERRRELEDATGGRTLEQVKADLAELDTLRDQSRNDTEKAIAKAKKDALAEAAAAYGPRLVNAAFSAALGNMKPEDKAELLDTINPAKFLTTNGDLDTDKVSAWITKYAPQTGTGVGGHVADHGAGRRSTTMLSPREQGLAEALKRFPPKATA